MKTSIIKMSKSIFIPVFIYLIFLIPNFERFGSFNSFYAIFIQSIIPTIIGYGVSFSFICGVFDFSIGSRMIIAGLLGGMITQYSGIPGLIIVGLVVSLILGIVTGAINRVARIPSLVVTLGLGMIYEILGQKISGTSSAIRLTQDDSIFGGAPYIIIIFLLTAIIFYIVFYYTKFSYQARAVGNEELIAGNMGVNVLKTKYLTFIVGSFFLGIAAILQISMSGTMSSQVNLSSATLLFKPLMGVLIALVISPFCNLALGIFIGTFTINIIFVGLLASGVPSTFQDVVLGLFLLIVMLLSENKNEIKSITNKLRKKLFKMN